MNLIVLLALPAIATAQPDQEGGPCRPVPGIPSARACARGLVCREDHCVRDASLTPPPVTQSESGPIEVSLFLYGGSAQSLSADVAYSSDAGASSGHLTGGGHNVGFRAALSLPQARFLEAAVDFSYYGADQATFTPISLLLLVGVPLGVNEDHPRGRIRPYGGGGPSWVPTNFGVNGGSAGSVSAFGIDARGGLALQVSPYLSLFGEYRALWASGSDDQHRTQLVWGVIPQDIFVSHSQLEMSAQLAVFGLAVHLPHE